jgi:twitching motility protein PilU
MNVLEYCKTMVEKDASDVYFTVARPPMYRIDGKIQPGDGESFKPPDLEDLAKSLLSDVQWAEFIAKKEMNLAISLPGVARFRVNVFRQRGSAGVVIRKIKVEIPTIEELGLPAVLKDIAMLQRGLVLVVGATGTGKTTTLAAMIDHRNSNDSCHIVTVEDPIEFVHRHKKSIVTQREIGFDTHSFQDALVNAMRQAPDVILIGEIRHTETMEAAITFADTGHLCFGTLHSTNASQSFERILNFFPEARHEQTLLQLSLNLRGIISQRLVPSVDGRRVGAVEVMLDIPYIKDLIRKGQIEIIKDAMEQSVQEGCQTFDQALFTLYKNGVINFDNALAAADSANNLRLKIKLAGLKGDEETERVQPPANSQDQTDNRLTNLKEANTFRLRRT